MQSVIDQGTKYAIIMVCLGFSIFIYANIVEQILFIDLPYISSIKKTDSPIYIMQAQESLKPERQVSLESRLGFFGKPVGIRFPRINYYLNLRLSEPETYEWKVLNNIASMYVYETSNAGVLGNSLVFNHSESNTMSFLVLLVEGDRFIVNTDSGYKYHYKITKKILTKADEIYTVESSNFNKLVLYQDVLKNNSRLVVEAEYLNIEEDIR